MGKNIATTIVIIVVLAIAGYFIYQNYQATAPASAPDSTADATTPPQTPPSQFSISVETQQTAERRISIKEAGFPSAGYVVIHLSENDKPGKTIGHSALFSPGTYQNIVVPVDTLKVGENQLFVMLHADDGNGVYEFPGADAPAKADDQIVVKPFATTMVEVKSGDAMQEPSTMNPVPTPPIKEFTITARQFAFEPDTITVNVGDTVRLTVKSLDVTHGLAISEFAVNTTLSPNSTKTVEFVASKAGTFQMFCSIYCGSGHSDMKGTLVVK